MKKIFITFMAAVSLLTFNRCTSLDMEPVSSISDANYWKSSDQFKAFNTGLHSLLRLRSYNIFVLGEPRADIYGDQPFGGEATQGVERYPYNTINAEFTGISNFGEQEKKEANNYPNIRFLLIEKATSPLPVSDIKAAGDGWQVCSSKSVADFSAAGYFFGRDLHRYQNVPIGLIDTSWGGTCIETWTSKEALATMPGMQKKLDVLKELPISSEDREKKFHSDVEDWKKEIEKIDKGFVDGRAAWTVTDFEDSAWKTMEVPGLMQEQGLKGFNGIVWFRKTIEIPAKWEGTKTF